MQAPKGYCRTPSDRHAKASPLLNAILAFTERGNPKPLHVILHHTHPTDTTTG